MNTATQTATKTTRHRTQPIAETLTYIKNYPLNLTLYKCGASRYWQLRYYADGRVMRRSTKTESKRQAIEYAKKYYDEIDLKRAAGVARAANPYLASQDTYR